MAKFSDSTRSPVSEPAAGRRVGTVTFGLVLLVSGIVMLISMFAPQLDFSWVLKGAPLMLVSLGVETLLAARGGGRFQYDWVGMLLCFLLVGTAIVLYVLSWLLIHSDLLRCHP